MEEQNAKVGEGEREKKNSKNYMKLNIINHFGIKGGQTTPTQRHTSQRNAHSLHTFCQPASSNNRPTDRPTGRQTKIQTEHMNE